MIKITKELIDEHGINDDEYNFILESLNREPTITELGIFSAMGQNTVLINPLKHG